MQNAKCRMQNYLISLHSTHTEKYKKALSLSLDRPRFLDEIRRKGKLHDAGQGSRFNAKCKMINA